MSATFDDATIAARTRDAIRRVAIKVLDEERPPYRYGTVTAINPDGKTLMVQFADGAAAVPVRLLGVQPAAVGQVVQVSGRQGDRFVSGVIGAARPADVSSTELDPPTGVTVYSLVESMNVQWTAGANATKYEVQLAEDSLFTVNVRTHPTVSNSFTFHKLLEATNYWVRVRSLNNSGAGSAWVASGPHQVDPFPQPSDGLAPSASPQPIVTAGIGYLYAEWLPVSNADPVDYEVHISTVSGFTPGATTLVQTVGSTFAFLRVDADGVPLGYDTTYFIRLIAKDADGAALVGAQGSGSPDRVETGDAGNIGVGNITDGLVPSASPDVTGIYNGVGFIMAKWTHISNVDPVQYEVHISTVTGFIPDANSYVGETPSNWFFIRNQGAGAAFAPLVQGTTYYVKLWAKDGDGYAAAPGLQGSGVTGKTSADDYATGSVSGSAIAALAIGEAHISALAVTSAKIADLAVSSAKIQDLAVGTAKIADLAVANAKIGALAVTNAKIADLSADKLTAGTINASLIAVTNLNASNITAGIIEGIQYRSPLGTNAVRMVLGDTASVDSVIWKNSTDENVAAVYGNSSGELYVESRSALNLRTTMGGAIHVNGSGGFFYNSNEVYHVGNHTHAQGTFNTLGSSQSSTGGNSDATDEDSTATGASSASVTGEKEQYNTGGASAGTSHYHPVYAHKHTMAHTHSLGGHAHSMNAHTHGMGHVHQITI